MANLEFNIPEIFSLFGVVQSLYILVYLGMRSKSWGGSFMPFLYFLVLGAAFFMDFATRFIHEISPYYGLVAMGLWFWIPPLSALVIIHLAQVTDRPFKHYGWVLGLPALALIATVIAAKYSTDCDIALQCEVFIEWFVLSNLIAGSISLLILWGSKTILRNVRRQKFGQERYWLILSFIFSNIFLLALMFGYFGDLIPLEDIGRIRTLLGLAVVYLVTTSLFRIYPQSAWASIGAAGEAAPLNAEETEIAVKIKALLELDKVYHEAGYNRRDLALELGETEGSISRIINIHFGKSLPQLLSEYRVEDAKRLLQQTQEPISVVASESGFSSIATFNRVFREIMGISPSEYRKNYVKNSG